MPSTTIPARYRSLAQRAAAASGLPLNVVAAQISEESRWDPAAVSGAGAEGIAQFMPGTWPSWGHGSPFNPSDAMTAYGKFMGYLLKWAGGDTRKALAAYNAGQNNWQAGTGYADTILAAAGLSQSSHSQAAVYGNPLRDVKNLTAERVDMGVDYSGTGPVHALGPGVITNTRNAGWPGGNFISEKLTAGPAAGRYVYVAEDITPAVTVGQKVDSSTVIGTMYNGGSGIETGWAEPPGSGWALGRNQFTGANATAIGKSYSDMLHSLGAPAGTMSGPVSGSLPGWLRTVLGAVESAGGNAAAGAGDIAAGAGGALSGLDGVASALGSMAGAVVKAEQAIEWFLVPTHWVRIIAFATGVPLVLIGIVTMGRTGRSYSVTMPGAGAIPAPGGELAPALGIAEVTIGAILLFVAFHNLPGDVTDFSSLLGYFAARAQSGGQ